MVCVVRRVAPTLFLLAVLAAVQVAAVLAARPATKAERVKLAAAVRAYVHTVDCCLTVKYVRIFGVSVSTVDARWATVSFDRFSRSGMELERKAALLQRGLATGRWSVRAYGSYRTFDQGGGHLGCAAPVAVRRDLSLHC